MGAPQEARGRPRGGFFSSLLGPSGRGLLKSRSARLGCLRDQVGSEVRAAPAAGGHTKARAQLIERTRPVLDRRLDLALGNAVADADEHLNR